MPRTLGEFAQSTNQRLDVGGGEVLPVGPFDVGKRGGQQLAPAGST